MHHHHHHCPPVHHHQHHHHHCHDTPCSPQPDPPFGRQQGLWNPAFWPALSPSPLPRSCSSSSSSGNTDVSCTVHVEEVPSTAAAEAPLLEPKPGDDGAVPAAALPAILFCVVFWGIFAWVVYSYWF